MSLINAVPEELISAGIRIEYIHTIVHTCLSATIQYIQVGHVIVT